MWNWMVNVVYPDLVHPLSKDERVDRLCYGYVRFEWMKIQREYDIESEMPCELIQLCRQFIGPVYNMWSYKVTMQSPTEIQQEQQEIKYAQKHIDSAKHKVLMLGLDAAGKTTIMYVMRNRNKIRFIEKYLNERCKIEQVMIGKVSVTALDLDEYYDKMRNEYEKYYIGNIAIIFVVDSNDRERIDMAHVLMHQILCEQELRELPLLILANKQDLPAAMGVSEITDKLGLNEIKDRRWYIQGTAACTCDGLYEGFDWVGSTVGSEISRFGKYDKQCIIL
eukprot:422466_1